MVEMHADRPYAVVWPRGRKSVEVKSMAKRLETLTGKTVGQLWDNMFRGDEIFPVLAAGLAQRFPGVTFVNYDIFGSTHGGDEHQVLADLPAKLQQYGVDAVISGMAC